MSKRTRGWWETDLNPRPWKTWQLFQELETIQKQQSSLAKELAKYARFAFSNTWQDTKYNEIYDKLSQLEIREKTIRDEIQRRQHHQMDFIAMIADKANLPAEVAAILYSHYASI